MPPDDAGHPMDPQHIFLDGRLDPTAVVDKVDGISFLPGANEHRTRVTYMSSGGGRCRRGGWAHASPLKDQPIMLIIISANGSETASAPRCERVRR